MTCPSCGAFPVERLALVCRYCAGLVTNPEPIQTIVPRIADEIEPTRKDAA